MEMRAALLYAPHDIRVETREVAPCGDHDIIINLKKACLCPTDIKKYNADKPDVEGALKEYGPCILGHEAAGVVVETGARVTAVKKGDRVAVQPMIFCGECGYCKEDRTNLCPHVIGVGCSAGGFGKCEEIFYEQGVGGCFATHLKVPEICAMKLPDSLSMEAGSLLEPLADVVHSVDHALTGPGDDVAVLGLGPMGLLHVAAARYNGARHVIAVDLDESRLDIARRLGADQIVNSRQGDPVAQVKALTGGDGRAFIDSRYTPANIVLYCVDPGNEQRNLRLLERHFGDLSFSGNESCRVTPAELPAFRETRDRGHQQANTIIGTRLFARNDPRRYALFLLNNILGGPCMNSRLNRELREKRGLVYTVDSALTLMSDCGSMLIYFGSQPDKVEKCSRIISDEISRLASDRLSPRAFDAARDQYCGQLTVSGDHRENCAMALAKSLLYFGEVHDIAHTAEQIRAVTPDDIRDMAALIASKELSRLTLT